MVLLFIRSLLVAAFVTLLILSSVAQPAPQPNDTTATIRVAANKQYNKVSGFKKMTYGKHYRKEWATEVDVPVLDMDVFAGGLSVSKLGGGKQTKSLRLKGRDGNEYVLRSVNKDPSKAIVEELRGTFAEDIVQDQISSSNPYAPLVVASLSQAAGIFHSTPQLVYVPASERLGEYSADFAETLCLIEQRPDNENTDNAAFGFSKNIVNTEKLLYKVFGDADHLVNERAFLKARLFDLLIGDWDRHEDQWSWAGFKTGGKTVYVPIPRDRDQAFSNLDGAIPQLFTRKWAYRQVQHFGYSVRDVYGLNANGGALDRNFTTRLTLKDWLEIAEELQEDLTDLAIEKAFKEMPEAIYAISGPVTEEKLKRRRDDLLKYTKQYYGFLIEEVNIVGTKDKEIFSVRRENNDSTIVTIYKNGNGDLAERVVYTRTFLRSETKEIRLYGLGGDDIFNIYGKTGKGILIRVIGGDGQDCYNDLSAVNQSGHQTKVYDNGDNFCDAGKEVKFHISNDTLRNEYHRKSFRFDWLAPTVNPGYNPDDGFFFGGGLIFKKQGFGKSPYASLQTIGGNYAFSTGASSVWYTGIFKGFAGKADLHLAARYNSPAYTRNFYGLGNETVNDENAEIDYYRVRISQLSVSSSLHRQLGKHHTLYFGSEFQSYKVEQTADRFVSSNDSKLDSSDFDRQKYGKTQLGYEFNSLNSTVYPTKGAKLKTSVAYTRNLDDSQKDFVQLSAEASFYHSFGRLTWVSRTGISSNLGNDYEFFQANELGGLENLRGYRRNRFAGKTGVYQNSEVRLRISDFNAYITKGSWGIMAFSDHGRVWMPEENSDQWHHGYGGGLWFLPFNKMALTATYGISQEKKLVSIKAGFLF